MLFLRFGSWKLEIGSSTRALNTQLPWSKEASTKKMSSSNSPCAACKFLRRKCTQECVFAPYFPPDQPQKFANVHRVFGAKNVSKILSELNAVHREEAVNSLAYEAEARLRDPVYGCVGLISVLQHKLKQIHFDLHNARKELAEYVGAPGLLPILPNSGFVQHHPNNLSSSTVMPYNMSQMMSLSSGPSNSSHQQFVIREPHQQWQNHQQLLDGQPLAAVVAAREQQMMRAYEHQHQQQEFMRFNSGFDPSGPVGANGFNQMSTAAMSPSLALGSLDSSYQIQQQQQESTLDLQFQSQLLIHESQQQQRSGSEEGRSVGPS